MYRRRLDIQFIPDVHRSINRNRAACGHNGQRVVTADRAVDCDVTGRRKRHIRLKHHVAVDRNRVGGNGLVDRNLLGRQRRLVDVQLAVYVQRSRAGDDSQCVVSGHVAGDGNVCTGRVTVVGGVHDGVGGQLDRAERNLLPRRADRAAQIRIQRVGDAAGGRQASGERQDVVLAVAQRHIARIQHRDRRDDLHRIAQQAHVILPTERDKLVSLEVAHEAHRAGRAGGVGLDRHLAQAHS